MKKGITTGLSMHLQRIRRRVESAMRNTDHASLISMGTVLLVLSRLYGGAMALRARLYEQGVLASKSLPCPVVSIGNIVAGGTGKTPMTICVAHAIKNLGYRVVVISRGYRGRLEKTGGVVSDGRQLFWGPEDAGDEPYLMAIRLRGIPVVVGRRRYEAGMLAMRRFQPDVIVLDDAFQHLRLKRDLNLVLMDHQSPLGNGHLLPRGRLREPVSALRRAHALIFTRSRDITTPSPFAPPVNGWAVFHTVHLMEVTAIHQGGRHPNDGIDLSVLQGRKAVAFAGLADNNQFFDALKQSGCQLVNTIDFADHHRYGHGEIDHIIETARAKEADLLITSHKDWVKIEHAHHWPIPVAAVDVRIGWIGRPDAFIHFLSETLTASGI